MPEIKLVLLNGPKASGKDTLLNLYLSQYGDDVGYERISEPLKDALSSLAFDCDFMIDYNSQEVKNEVIQNSNPPRTVREALIQLGDWSRKYFGPHFLSRQCGTKVRTGLEDLYSIVFVPDIRTQEDVEGILATCGLKPYEILLVRISREGHVFSDDLGYYLSDDILSIGGHILDITNRESEPEHMLTRLIETLESCED